MKLHTLVTNSYERSTNVLIGDFLIEQAKLLRELSCNLFVGYTDSKSAAIENAMKESYICLVDNFLELLITQAEAIEEDEEETNNP